MMAKTNLISGPFLNVFAMQVAFPAREVFKRATFWEIAYPVDAFPDFQSVDKAAER